MLVRSKHESRGLARRALAVELRRKGIGEADAEEALGQVDDEAEEAAARRLLAKRWRSGQNLEPQVRARRAAAMLARKGYSAGLVSRLVREMLDEDGPRTWDSEGPGVD